MLGNQEMTFSTGNLDGARIATGDQLSDITTEDALKILTTYEWSPGSVQEDAAETLKCERLVLEQI